MVGWEDVGGTGARRVAGGTLRLLCLLCLLYCNSSTGNNKNNNATYADELRQARRGQPNT
jgi:hypothetical protein